MRFVSRGSASLFLHVLMPGGTLNFSLPFGLVSAEKMEDEFIVGGLAVSFFSSL